MRLGSAQRRIFTALSNLKWPTRGGKQSVTARRNRLIDVLSVSGRFSTRSPLLLSRCDGEQSPCDRKTTTVTNGTHLISLTWCDCDCRAQVPMDATWALRRPRVPSPSRMCPSRRCFASDSRARLDSVGSCSSGWSDWAPSMVVAGVAGVVPRLSRET